MLELIASSEFGDWLMTEIATATERCGAADAAQSQAARQRLAQLEAAREVLHEYLLLQQAMLARAGDARQRGGPMMGNVQNLLDRR